MAWFIARSENQVKKVKYAKECSCFYSCGELTFWNEVEDKEICTIQVTDIQVAKEIMKEFKRQAPYQTKCLIYDQ